MGTLTAVQRRGTIADVANLRGEAARLAILRLVVHLNGLRISPSFRDVARSLELAKASVQLHVKALRRAGLLEHDAPIRATQAGIDLIHPPTAD